MHAFVCLVFRLCLSGFVIVVCLCVWCFCLYFGLCVRVGVYLVHMCIVNKYACM